ncbi:hypothetical protein [Paludibaculum fermentans]|uniref:Uncharacterized protein n=1 Tax=Paludibaculum fermentans TaxID=1473598 RepID=A0A7S7SND3_PALFE|nr:hypothetical protein [Paludibaculum fermentans]QOY89995.1 hypothetical protein IRI77_08570 [Paludibaculum fermentans]
MSYIEYVTSGDPANDVLPELARTNQFSMEDLQQNRAGRISDAQWMRLLFRSLRPVRYTGGALLGWLFCCFIVKALVPDIILTIASYVGAKGIGIIFGGATLACVGAFLVSLFSSARTMSLLVFDLRDGKAVCLEGRVRHSREEEEGLGMARFHGENHTKHCYVVKDDYFEVDEDAFKALPDGLVARVYHTPRSKLLLSIEPR